MSPQISELSAGVHFYNSYQILKQITSQKDEAPTETLLFGDLTRELNKQLWNYCLTLRLTHRHLLLLTYLSLLPTPMNRNMKNKAKQID